MAKHFAEANTHFSFQVKYNDAVNKIVAKFIQNYNPRDDAVGIMGTKMRSSSSSCSDSSEEQKKKKKREAKKAKKATKKLNKEEKKKEGREERCRAIRAIRAIREDSAVVDEENPISNKTEETNKDESTGEE